MGELLGALGLAWPRLLIYPGGLSALGLAWLLALWMRFAARQNPSPREGEGQGWGGVADALPPLLALALLPLPPARAFPYGIDLVVALALLGWPRLRAHAAAGRLAGSASHELLVGYGLLLLGASLMGGGAGGIELSRLAQAPTTVGGWGLLLGGGGLWMIGQAWLYAREPGWAARLGELGQLWVAAMPLLAALAALIADRLPDGWAGWALPPLALLAAALLLGLVRRLLAAGG